jgi:hypothetical protein
MLELLGRQADLCERLELRLLTERIDPAELDAARAQWEQLPTQPDHTLQRALVERFEFALGAGRDHERLKELRQRHAANGKRRARLCLQLEILAGVESPPEFSQQRLESQVARLAERMVEGEEDPLQDTARLLRDWYLCGPAPRDEALDARFERIRRALAPDLAAA